ncbi:hypothetical protein ACHAWF_002358 [Thalassiosira exigua]
MLEEKWKESITLNARTFLRAGWKQIPEVVGPDRTPWFFAFPNFFEASLFSHEDVEDIIKIHVPPGLPPSPTGADMELLALVVRVCNGRKSDLDPQRYNIERQDRILENDKDLKAKVKVLVAQERASVRKSYALNCSTLFLFVDYIDFLLGFSPDTNG